MFLKQFIGGRKSDFSGMLLLLRFYFLIPDFWKFFSLFHIFLSLFHIFKWRKRAVSWGISLLLTEFATERNKFSWDIYVCTLCIFIDYGRGNRTVMSVVHQKINLFSQKFLALWKKLLGLSIWGSIPDISAKVSQMFLNSYAFGTPQQIIYLLLPMECFMFFLLTIITFIM